MEKSNLSRAAQHHIVMEIIESEKEMRTVDDELHLRRHKQMLKFQEEIKPFTPTIRELVSLWGLKTTSATHATIRYLVNCGYVIERRIGDEHKYYAVEAE